MSRRRVGAGVSGFTIKSLRDAASGDGDGSADHNGMLAALASKHAGPPPVRRLAVTRNRRFIIDTFNGWVSKRFVPAAANRSSDGE